MPDRSRHLFPKRWLDAIRPDADLAAAEGLAAGTGLLTGALARTTTHVSPSATSCPVCHADSEVLVVDLVARSTTLRCQACGRRWVSETVAADPAAG
jgi:hypothetical protein